jgi:hypothetical protein
VPAVLARVHAPQPEETPSTGWQKKVAAIAAAVVLAACALALVNAGSQRRSLASVPRPSVPESESNKRALDWFVRTQESDGSWSAERWGGQRNYAPALTALPLLALTATDAHTPTRDAAAARAAASLLRQQNGDGTFGPSFQGTPYNNSIATLALLHTWQQDPRAVPREALDKAVTALMTNQTGAGAWGYRQSPLGDRSITQWHVQALGTAALLGWPTAAGPVERGVRWLAQHGKPLTEAEEPDDSTSAILARSAARPARRDGSVDFYHSYFTAAALKHDPGTEAGERLASLRREILRHQVREGEEIGSWAPDDQWGRAGGRLYSTALASLSLSSR